MGAFDGLKAGQVDNGCESYLRTSLQAWTG